MQRTDWFQENCPITRPHDPTGERWSLLILPGAPLSRMAGTAAARPVAGLEVASDNARRLRWDRIGPASVPCCLDPA